jgi:hypothetical protein
VAHEVVVALKRPVLLFSTFLWLILTIVFAIVITVFPWLCVYVMVKTNSLLSYIVLACLLLPIVWVISRIQAQREKESIRLLLGKKEEA